MLLRDWTKLFHRLSQNINIGYMMRGDPCLYCCCDHWRDPVDQNGGRKFSSEHLEKQIVDKLKVENK